MQVERGARCGASPADEHDGAKLFLEFGMILGTTPPEKRDTAAKQGIGHAAATGYAKPAFVQKGALALFGIEEFVLHRIENTAGSDGLAALRIDFHHRDRDREMRNAVKEVGGAVQRVNSRLARQARFLDDAAFLKLESPARPCLRQFLADGLLGIDVARLTNPPGPCG